MARLYVKGGLESEGPLQEGYCQYDAKTARSLSLPIRLSLLFIAQRADRISKGCFQGLKYDREQRHHQGQQPRKKEGAEAQS